MSRGKGLVNSQMRRCFSPRKFLEKSLKNPLTNLLKCGIIYTERGRESMSHPPKEREIKQ